MSAGAPELAGGASIWRGQTMNTRAGWVGLILFIACVCFNLNRGNLGQLREFSPDGKFKVLMPGTPEERTESRYGLTVRIWHVQTRDRGCGVIVWDSPPGTIDDPNEELDDCIRAASIAERGFKPTKVSNIMLAGKYPGRACDVQVPEQNTSMKVRAYFVGGRLYLIYAIGKDRSFVDSEDVTKFLDSFQLTDEAEASAVPKGADKAAK
jgi:hypothetical protein